MSEESNPSPLRLKPRLRPEATDADENLVKTPAPVAPASGETGETARLRLKPRLETEPTTEPDNSTVPALAEAAPTPAAPALETEANRCVGSHARQRCCPCIAPVGRTGFRRGAAEA